VKEGDTLGSIARENNVSYKDLARWNNIDDPNRIVPSQQLKLSAP
jgi:lipoprotein NlpD